MSPLLWSFYSPTQASASATHRQDSAVWVHFTKLWIDHVNIEEKTQHINNWSNSAKHHHPLEVQSREVFSIWFPLLIALLLISYLPLPCTGPARHNRSLYFWTVSHGDLRACLSAASPCQPLFTPLSATAEREERDFGRQRGEESTSEQNTKEIQERKTPPHQFSNVTSFLKKKKAPLGFSLLLEDG